MTASTSKHEPPTIEVDESRVYQANAGQCPKCGNFKTWDFRVLNPKSGKMMPGHITKDGFKINNGDCPFYAAFRKNDGSSSSSRDEGAIDEDGIELDVPEEVLSNTPPARATTAPGGKVGTVSISKAGDRMIVSIGKCKASISTGDAIRVTKALLDAIDID